MIVPSSHGVYKGTQESYVLDSASAPDLKTAANQKLTNFGFVVIRGLFSSDHIHELHEKTETVMQKPSLGGSVGYYAKDCMKRVYDPFFFGPKAVDITVNEAVLDIAESYMQGEAILSEIFAKKDLGINDAYFPVHSDFAPGMNIGNNAEIPVTKELMQSPFAVGGMLYLHDTNDGAFCYATGTHKLEAPHGTTLETYPADMRQSISAAIQKVDGKAGDLVLFDDRGFHGPEQPSSATRTVFIFDYYCVDKLGRYTKSPAPLFLNDVSHLNQRQLRVLGLGAKIHIDYTKHHTRQFSRNHHYSYVARVFNWGFGFQRFKRRLRRLLRGEVTTYLPGRSRS